MSVMMIKKKRRVRNIIPTRIEVTSFNGLDNQILNDEERSLNNGHRCIDDNQSNNVIGHNQELKKYRTKTLSHPHKKF
jgi:hypothetical protein